MLTLFFRGAVAAAAVVVLSACGGESPDTPAAQDTTRDDGTLAVLGTDTLEFVPEQLSAAAGEVTVELTSEPGIPHTFAVDETGDEVIVDAPAGETATGTIQLEPGTYTFYCSVPGHRAAGMEGTLTVD